MTEAVLFFDHEEGRSACVTWDGKSWTMERYENGSWIPDGPLTEKGRAGLIKVLRLGEFGESLMLNDMRHLAAHQLEKGKERFRAARSAAALSFVR